MVPETVVAAAAVVGLGLGVVGLGFGLVVFGVVGLGLGVVGFLLHASALRCKYTRVHTEREVKEITNMCCHRYQQKH